MAGSAPVVGPVLAQLGHAGGDGGQTALSSPAPAPPASGQLLDVGQRRRGCAARPGSGWEASSPRLT